ncbi:MAG: hypothetical protein KC931_24825, partial [Candidatus Omnitrophica bacterium]|nr:hypothetical protein [Candidatus Omnitrophota bacterium]
SLVYLWGSPVSAQTGAEWVQVTGEADWPARWKHTSVSYDGKLWVMGGNRSLNDVWSSPNGEGWTLVTGDAEWTGREDHTSLVYNGKMWVMGGWFDRSSIFGRLNDVWSSTDGSQWEAATMEAPWSARYGHASVVHNGKMWVLGGYRGDTYLNDAWYSTDGVNWTAATLDGGWPARADMTSASFDGKIWIMGGNSGEPGRDYLLPYNDVWFSEDGASWIQAVEEAPWIQRRFHSSVVFRDRFWLFGGGYPYFLAPFYNMTNEVWWTTDGANWTLATASADWIPRGEHTSVVHDGKMWILGGANQEEGRLNDVWYSSSTEGISSDINEDGVVDSDDLVILMSDWKKVSAP